jgi:hypothetical protein
MEASMNKYTRSFAGAVGAVVGCMAAAQLGRGADLSPFAVALMGMLCGMVAMVYILLGGKE